MVTAVASDVKVLGSWTSPFVMRPRIALNIKSVDYEFLQEEFGSKSDLLLKSNPVYKKIPVLIHNDKPVSESMIIVQYVDETFTGPSILPTDAYERALARFWAVYVDDRWWFESLRGVAAGKTDAEKATALEGVTSGLALLEEAFEKLSKGKGFFGGDTIGYLDIALGSCLGWIRVTEKFSGTSIIDETKLPNIYAWSERFCSDPAVKELMPDTEKLFEFANMLFAKTSGAAAAAPPK
ncbi:Glutathione s-transferase u17 [Thalictrum thalictroides]|uniref:glutathione transferase n=1 Tax=Thalictrum thalictroides TaxID=46969 RepID=A0A7J6VLI0_THATH|nr:Glutathione s-transferase u17 [Thalictrum thalictroides]